MKGFYYLVFLLTLVAGCSSTKNLDVPAESFASLYNPSEFSLNTDYKFYHLNDDMTSLYIRLYPGELLFNQANPENEYRALVTIDYVLYELDDRAEIVNRIDSARITLKLNARDQERSAYFASKVLEIVSGKQYLIRLEAKDKNRGALGLKHVYIDKRNIYSAQNFSVIGARTAYPKFLNYFVPGERFRLVYRNLGIDTMYLDIFADEDDLPRPVVLESDSSYTFGHRLDTTIVLPFSDSLVFTLPDRGMYHLRVDSLIKEGITLHNFGPDFPQVKSDKGLMEPLFYIATLAEYRNMKRSENLKLAVDDFWLQLNPYPDRARELIRIYYNRVLYSNLYFTADNEGWKTDRGMIFILFGPPDRMRDTGKEQRWYYISQRQGRVIEFVFERKQSLFTNHDMVWKKTYETLQYWSSAISAWRTGKVYSFNR
ncbi:MAG: GWxTD domain-containing protein [Bacteroidales bacterium]|nr:GWxTD domain-containing protein [Bacteroidales bacterium]